MMEARRRSASCVTALISTSRYITEGRSRVFIYSLFTHSLNPISILIRELHDCDLLFLSNMFFESVKFTALAVGLLSSITTTVNAVPSLEPRQIPANATDVTTIKSPTGVTIRYKEPGKAGVCETTPGVGSYAGYVDLSPTSHTFFWFFEARHKPESAPLTLVSTSPAHYTSVQAL